jgi:dTDP-glucose 4,6-dehydratase
MRPHDGRVVTSFIVQALMGEPLTIYGDGEQTRSFCFVEDLIAGIVAMTESRDPGPINLGNPAECTINDLARTVRELTGSAAPVVYHPRPVDDPMRRRPRIDLAWERLRWRPTVPIEDGLRRTIDWFTTRPSEVRASLAVIAGGQLDGVRIAGSGGTGGTTRTPAFRGEPPRTD